MDEKIMVEFSGEELDAIHEYQKKTGVNTVQEAVMNAVKKDS